ncbi:DUF962 domain-containing protein [Vibrio tapetis]|uniref:Putative PRS2 protein n=1 Tax=Vibrio tapetis subsp. tapetis TaxID=1671868 RepID=A0A2N8ZMC6_9VIBR|nr:Mpo1-like protein [Vibrio tapetis]SON53039.1 putative PRS2 protein [Vibrio tapetis subsp. tapetis]
MRTQEQWLAAYAESHQNPANKRIHTIAVPGIYLSIVGLIWSIPSFNLFGITLNWVFIALAPVLTFYALLSVITFLMMAAYSTVCIGIVAVLSDEQAPILDMSIGLFVVLWVFQFIGHKIEGKKPSFLDDISFLLIGPVWVFKGHKLSNQDDD